MRHIIFYILECIKNFVRELGQNIPVYKNQSQRGPVTSHRPIQRTRKGVNYIYI